ncbi:MAG: alkaline phosphatase family protein [Promethearchaeota archaeon]
MALDGLSWNVINDMINNGKLKNLKRIIDDGSSGIMRADHPLVSPEIWCSIFTGKSKEKHGIIDFFSKNEDLRSDQIWDILNNNGFKIGIYRPLSAWNIKKVDGFFVPSPLSFENEAHPRKLNFIHELDQKARTDRISLLLMVKNYWKFIKYHFSIKKLLTILKTTILLLFKKDFKEKIHLMKKIEFIIHTSFFYKLLKKYKPEFSILYENSCDTISHIYWKEKDEDSKFSDVIFNIYLKIDEFIGKIKKFTEKNNINLLIISDHGFKLRGSSLDGKFKTIKVSNLLKKLNLEKDVLGINLTEKALLRLKPYSLLSLEEIKKIIESIRCENKNLFKIERLDDRRLLIEINDSINIKGNLEAKLPIGGFSKLNLIIDLNPLLTGTHCQNNGVFIIRGENIKEGLKIEEIKPYDIIPTILSLLDVPIPFEVDGKVLKEIFKELPKEIYFNKKDKEDSKRTRLSKEEEEKIKEKLKSWGYL